MGNGTWKLFEENIKTYLWPWFKNFFNIKMVAFEVRGWYIGIKIKIPVCEKITVKDKP